MSGKDLANTIINAINSLSFFGEESKQFIRAMSLEHRTLQQSFTRLCVEWFRYLSRVESFDLRNEASVKLAKRFVETCDRESSLPFF